MLEILTIIVLSCQTSGGNTSFTMKLQKECRNKLIECVEDISPKTDGASWSKGRLVNCMKDM